MNGEQFARLIYAGMFASDTNNILILRVEVKKSFSASILRSLSGKILTVEKVSVEVVDGV